MMALIPLLVLFGVLMLAALYVVAVYNRLVRLGNTVKSAWSDIDVQLKKRYDLVPNLAETVEGYAGHEESIFRKVTEARSMAMSASGPDEAAHAENVLRGTLKSLFAVAEAYPDLKANQNFLQLQAQLRELEDTIESARRYYNAVVRDFNTLIEQFPSNLIASRFQFEPKKFFELQAPEVERQPAKVEL